MSVQSGPAFYRYGLIALLTALPFLVGFSYLYRLAEEAETVPFGRCYGLHWRPTQDGLAYLYQSAGQKDSQLWVALGSEFKKLTDLTSDYQWSLSGMQTGGKMLILGTQEGKPDRLALNDGTETVEILEVESQWKLIQSEGEGLYFFSVPSEPTPDTTPGTTPSMSPSPQATVAVDQPSRLEVVVSQYNLETKKMDSIVTIPYGQESEQPSLLMVSSSPDKRFLAMVLRFGEVEPGLWIYDKQQELMFWSGLTLAKDVNGMTWSPDSVGLAVTDLRGVFLFRNALEAESINLEVSAANDLAPRWGKDDLYLVNKNAIYRVVPEDGKVELKLALETLDAESQELAFDPIKLKVAYATESEGLPRLVERDLNGKANLQELPFPGSAPKPGQGTVFYQMGSAIRYAWKRLSGRG